MKKGCLITRAYSASRHDVLGWNIKCTVQTVLKGKPVVAGCTPEDWGNARAFHSTSFLPPFACILVQRVRNSKGKWKVISRKLPAGRKTKHSHLVWIMSLDNGSWDFLLGARWGEKKDYYLFLRNLPKAWLKRNCVPKEGAGDYQFLLRKERRAN